MSHISFVTKFHTFLLFLTLVAFSMTYAVPGYCMPTFVKSNGDEITLMMCLEKNIERLMKMKEKGKSNDMVDLMLEIKDQVEEYTGNAIDVQQQLKGLEKDLRKAGLDLPKKKWNQITKFILKRENKFNDRKTKIASLIDSECDFAEEMMLFEMSKDGTDDKDIPLRTVFGVTVALCGLFLVCLPLPPAKLWGQRLIETGVFLAVEGGINKKEKDDEKKK